MVDESTRKTLSGIPLLQTKAGPRDKDLWVKRLKEEYQALIKVSIGPFFIIKSKSESSTKNLECPQYVQNNKESDSDWFRLESNKEGTKWFGKCWYVHNLLKYEFDVEFDVSPSRQSSSQHMFQFFTVLLPDSSHLSNDSTRDCPSRVRWKNCKNVSRWQNLSD